MMTGAIFCSWLDYFIKHTPTIKEHQTQLIVDSPASQICIEVTDKARDNGIVRVTFPLYTSHKLQPLDRTVYVPMKRYFNTAYNDWQLSNPVKTIYIHDIRQLLGKAYMRAFTPENATSVA